MTLGSDQNLDLDRLSPTARQMHDLRDAVLDEWMIRLRRAVKEAADLPHPILINTFPSLYENLTQAITPDYPRATVTEGTTVAAEHGGERARLTNYNARAVIAEYQLLRWTIFDILKTNGVELNSEEFFSINSSIDEAIRESVSAFALGQSALRERFVAALTHDLRSPLSTAMAAAEVIKRSNDLAVIKDFARRISDNLLRADTMIQEMLDSILFQSGERLRLRLEQFDILEMVRNLSEEYATLYGPRVVCSGVTVTGWWDREALKRVTENLIGNALKYGAPDTPVTIHIGSSHERMLLTVHNLGDPISVEQMEDVFQVFQRAAAAREGDQQGWGIGLPYVRSVAESHGGSVSVDSTHERGTTFLVDIPLDARPFLDAPVLDAGPPSRIRTAEAKKTDPQ